MSSYHADFAARRHAVRKWILLIAALTALAALLIVRSLRLPTAERPPEIAAETTALPATATAAPTAEPSLAPPPLSFDAASISADNASLTLIGMTGPNLPVVLSIDGVAVGESTADGQGVWQLTVPNPPPGAYQIAVQALGPDGLPLASVTRELQVPALTPTPQLDATAVAAETPTTPETPTAEPEPTAVPEPTAEPELAQPTLIPPADIATFVGGWLRMAGTAVPNSQVELVWQRIDDEPQTQLLAADDAGNWQYETWIFRPGNYVVTARRPGTDSDPALQFAIDPAIFATRGSCRSGIPPFGERRDNNTYVIADCEYLALIAERLGITLQALLGANRNIINPSAIRAGDILNLPPRE